MIEAQMYIGKFTGSHVPTGVYAGRVILRKNKRKTSDLFVYQNKIDDVVDDMVNKLVKIAWPEINHADITTTLHEPRAQTLRDEGYQSVSPAELTKAEAYLRDELQKRRNYKLRLVK